jgi:hypothetical protein
MDLVSQVLSGNYTFLSSLPYELLFRIALQLDLPNIQRLCRVSQVFRELCQDEYFWLTLYRRDISRVRLPPATTSVRQSYQQIMAQFSPWSNQTRSAGLGSGFPPSAAGPLSSLLQTENLIEASRHGYEQLVNSILQTIPSPDRFTLNRAMAEASRGGHQDIVKQMLDLGANNYTWSMAVATAEGHQDIRNLIRSYKLRRIARQ